MRMIILIIATVILWDAVIAADFKFECLEKGNATPPIVNETQYSYQVTINIAGKNQSIEAYEVYDTANGTIVLYVHYPSAENSSIWITESIHHDFNYNQTFTINRHARTCNVTDFMHNETFSIFGYGIENGFQNLDFSFQWTGDYNYTLDNATEVNGIPAEKYSTCMVNNDANMKYDVDVYFSADGWSTRSGENTPLMVILKVNKTKDGTSFDTETYTYSFTSYQRNTWIPWISDTSDTPWDIVCEGRKDNLPPPEVGDSYGATEEVFLNEQKFIFSSHRYYDFDEKLYRFDFVGPKNATSKMPLYHHHYSIIHDFHEGVEYFIDKETGNCSINSIHLHKNKPWLDFDVESDPTHEGYVRMRSMAELYKERNYTYTGRHRHRGRTVDTWTSTIPMRWNTSKSYTELNETILFTTPDWSNGNISPVPLASIFSSRSVENGTTKTNKMTVHLSNVSPRMHGLHMFDVGSCYNKDASKSFVLMFDGTYGQYIDDYSSVMNVALQAAVAKAANVSKLRVSTWSSKELGYDRASGKENPEERLFVTVYMYDHPYIHGNVSELTPSINLTKASANLKDAVGNNKLLVQFKLASNEMISMTAFPSYFKEQSSLYSPPPPPAPAPTAEGLSNGGIAGLCIGMAFIGFLIGAIVVHVRYKRGNRQFGYHIQD